jgi:hypothetical protein
VKDGNAAKRYLSWRRVLVEKLGMAPELATALIEYKNSDFEGIFDVLKGQACAIVIRGLDISFIIYSYTLPMIICLNQNTPWHVRAAKLSKAAILDCSYLGSTFLLIHPVL